MSDGPSLSPHEFTDLSKAFLDPLEKKVTQLVANHAKKTLLEAWQNIKRILSTSSEIFFRRDMGERYFSDENWIWGLMLWSMASLVSCFLVCPLLAHFFLPPVACTPYYWFISLVAWLVAYLQYRWGMDNRAALEKYRSLGTAYHSRSQGICRWGPHHSTAIVIMALVLLVFDPCAFVLFWISRGITEKLAAEQRAAIWSSYFDELDRRIEQEFLDKALLGECDIEITHLREQLPARLNEDLRRNVAAACAGKPIKIIGRPRVDDPNCENIDPAAASSIRHGNSQPDTAAKREEDVARGGAQAGPVGVSTSAPKRVSPDESAATHKQVLDEFQKSRKELIRDLRKGTIRYVMIHVAMFVVILAIVFPYGIWKYFKSHPELTRFHSQVVNARPTVDALGKPFTKDRATMISQIDTLLDQQSKAIDLFRSNCDTEITGNADGITKLPAVYQGILGAKNAGLKQDADRELEANAGWLERMTASRQMENDHPDLPPQALLTNVQVDSQRMDKERAQILAGIAAMKAGISNAIANP